MRKSFLVPAAVGLACALAQPAFAANPHFKPGGLPTCWFSTVGIATDSVTCQGGTLAGLGNVDMLFTMSGSGFATFTCRNKGGHEAPGQNKVHVGVPTVATAVPVGSIKNGTVSGVVVGPATVPTPSASAKEAGCPNGNWTATPKTVGITYVQMLIQQPVATTIFTCTASSADGFGNGQTVTLACA